jgi:hypothetical protein
VVYADTVSRHGGFPRISGLAYSNAAGCGALRRAVAGSPGLLMGGGIKRGIKRVARVRLYRRSCGVSLYRGCGLFFLLVRGFSSAPRPNANSAIRACSADRVWALR